jgi:hypothetical protein
MSNALTNDTAGWQRYIDDRIGQALQQEREVHHEAVGEVLGDFVKELDDDIAKVRQELAAMRAAPIPLFAGPDDRLVRALAGIAESLATLQKDVADIHRDQDEQVARADLALARHQIGQWISGLEEHAETIINTLRSAHTIIFSACSAVERVHALLARLALQSGNEDALTLLDKNFLPAEEKNSAVINLAELRHAKTA